MKHTLFAKGAFCVALCALAILTAGCVKENLDACSKLTIRVENIKGDDITNLGMVEGASLYIFDEKMNHLETRQVDKEFITSHAEVKLDNYPDRTILHIVAWANMVTDNQTINNAKRLEELKLVLKSANEQAVSPDSLYFGSREVVSLGSGIVGGDGEIPVRIKVGTITMKTLGLQTAVKSYGLKNASDFAFFMNRTLDTYDYQGKQTGDSVYYNPGGLYDASQEWITTGYKDRTDAGGMQTVFSGQNLSFDINKSGQLLQRITMATDAETGLERPISVGEGERVDVLFIFSDGNISARMRISPWGVVDDQIEF